MYKWFGFSAYAYSLVVTTIEMSRVEAEHTSCFPLFRSVCAPGSTHRSGTV